ncbi:alkaline phosphatase [Pantoea stewartii]|uniref:alkaline phosphatase n=1 Tax=Pantoea stewartii TaxID=66269 RepID=UPI0023F98DB8|nr:alkaline phosphatase [Pantoea stewartii]MDF7785054.1 alkaline phosphatase [Pantoea stewartii]
MSRKPRLYRTAAAFSLGKLSLLMLAMGGMTASSAVLAAEVKAKNVIIMINDGAGWGTWDATAYWQYGSRESTPYAAFPAKYAMTTYPLNASKKATHNNASLVNYDPQKAWDTTRTDNKDLPFRGYDYLAVNPTDSAAAGTALASGIKTYNNAINVDNNGQPVDFVTLTAKAMGKATGVVTSVPFSHATPAAFGAQNASRNDYHAIAKQMLTSGKLDLIMGTGLPGFNANGTDCQHLASNETTVGCGEDAHRYLSEADWTLLNAGKLAPAGGQPWKVVRSTEAFARLASGALVHSGPLLGSPNVAPNGTLQQGRQAAIVGKDAANPSGDAFIATVPTLNTMTRGAIQHLSKNPDGFFMMVEGGATDWSAHTSNACSEKGDWGNSYNPNCVGVEYGRLIEESADFNNAVASVIEWVEKNSNWNETLLIVTTDHDNGMPMGPDAQNIPFQAVINKGKGMMPGISFRPTGNHSNALVPLWAKGVGADAFAERVRGNDAGYAKHVGYNQGDYIDNTDVFTVLKAVLEGRAVEKVTPDHVSKS